MPMSTERVPVGGQEMTLYLSTPDGPGPFAGVVVIHHAGGVDTFTRTMADRLAAAGFAAAAPNLFHRLSDDLERKMPHLRDPEVIADVNATVDFLRQHPGVYGEQLGITGFCMGGRVVYLMAAANPHFKAATRLSWPRTLDFFARHLKS